MKALGAREAAALIARGEVDVVDVREPSEWASGHVAGSRLVPLDVLRTEPEKNLPRDNVLFLCAKGARSQVAAKVAERQGFGLVYSLDGGLKAWKQAGLPLVTDEEPVAPPADQPALAELIAGNLRELRAHAGMSVDALAKLSGVSRADIEKIELGKDQPSLEVVWKFARALRVPFATLVTAAERQRTAVVRLRSSQARKLVGSEGRFGSRPLFPTSERGPVEFYELWLAGHSREDAEAHQPGTRENLVVTAGRLVLELAGESHRLEAGDAIAFDADVPHSYVNPASDECWMHLVMKYAPQERAQ
jgi:rhodanese-related sulfurtransferase/transcriptional regulator with XRE-family HTH domain